MSLALLWVTLRRRLPALLLLLVIAGCSLAGSPPAANSAYDRDDRMFTAAYEDIDQLYIRKVDLEDLVVGGLATRSTCSTRGSPRRTS
jgi:hypothetical protein